MAEDTIPIAPPPPAAWYGTPDSETMGYLQNRGWDKLTPTEVALAATKAHREAEKLIGAPQEQILRMPKDLSDVEGWNKVHARLGVPEKAADYDFTTIKFTDGREVGADEVTALQTMAKELNLPKATAQLLAQKLIKISETEGLKFSTEQAAKLAQETEKLTANWGAGRATNKIVADNAMAKFGITSEQQSALEKTIGYAATMEMFRSIGTSMGEDKFVRGGGPTPGALTKDEATYKMDLLMKDRLWADKLYKGDVLAVQEFNDLTRRMTGA
jgi:hypothetical protein